MTTTVPRIPEPVLVAAVNTLLATLMAPVIVRSIRGAHPGWALAVVITAVVSALKRA